MNDLTLFAADSLASPSATPAPAAAPTTPATSGRTSPHAFAYFDPDGCSSKTSLDFSPPTAASPADAYAAGLTDGEGTLTIWQRQGYHHATVEIGMTLPALDVLRSMQQEYGGKVTKMRSATGRWVEAWRWRIFGTEATDFVRRIRPALRLKGPQADILLRLATIPTSSTEAAGLKTKIQELNRKGPTRAPNVVPGVWRPAQQSLLPDLMPSLVIWPNSGMTSNGSAYQRRPLVPRTSATESSSWPTPNASTVTFDGPSCSGDGRAKPNKLGWAVKMWPTPSAQFDSSDQDPEVFLPRREREKAKHQNGNGFGLTLGMAVKLWPTPTAGDAKSSGSRNLEGSKAHPGVSLTDAVRTGDSTTPRRWRTPSASDGLGGPMNPADRLDQGHNLNLKEQVWDGGGNGSLNPTWVEWLMGFPPGWTDLDASATPSSPRSPNSSDA